MVEGSVGESDAAAAIEDVGEKMGCPDRGGFVR